MKKYLVIINYDTEEPCLNKENIKYISYKTLLEIPNNNLEYLLDNIDGLIISGGPQHIPYFDNHPELLKEIYLIYYAIKKKIIILGICLGFQLLNHYFGNIVTTLTKCVIGCNKINLETINTHGDEVLGNIDFNLLASGFSFHYDGVKANISKELLVIAKDNNNNLYFVKHKYLPIYGVQLHPEACYYETKKCLKKYKVNQDINLPDDSHLEKIRRNFFIAILGIENIF